MKNMTLSNIANACNGKLYIGNTVATSKTEGNVNGLVLDSRLVKEGYVFIASKGERVDGHDYIDKAIKQGAIAVICQKALPNIDIPYILVDDSLLALKAVATWYRMQLNIPVIGITGSVGKTSTKEFVTSVLSTKYKVLKTEGNYNNEIGLPLTILQIRKDHDIAVLEMGISEFGEMRRLSEIAKPDYCVLTNIGPCHLENLGSRQGVLRAKSEIFEFMSKDGRVILNGDDDMLTTITSINGNTPIRYGLAIDNDVYAEDIISQGLLGSTYNIHIQGEVLGVTNPMAGNHMILNSLAATSVGYILGLTSNEISQGLEQIKPLSGRNNIITHDKWTIIDDCYNANPVSMKSAIDLLVMADTRKVAILGDMGELGPSENDLHKDIGKYVASKNVDIILLVGKLSAQMYEGAVETLLDNRENLFYFETRDELLDALADILRKDDTILVKASHFMGFDQIVNVLV